MAIREMQMKITLKFHPTPEGMATKKENNKCQQDCRGKEPFYAVGEEANQYHYGNHYEDSTEHRNST